MVKNEADKYLERVLRRCHEFSDEVLVLDDGSTDNSDRLAWRLGCGVKHRAETGMWGNESPARAELWDWGARVAGQDGWLLICDADMILEGNPRPLMFSTEYNSWAWHLYDIWDEEHLFRCDGFWQGHTVPRPWFFKPAALGFEVPIWNSRGIHVGHCPLNAQLSTGIDPTGSLFWKHLAYLKKNDRLQKRDRYLGQAHQLTSFERQHAESVGD